MCCEFSAEMIMKQKISDDGTGQQQNEFYGEAGEKTAQE